MSALLHEIDGFTMSLASFRYFTSVILDASPSMRRSLDIQKEID
jgi:hypothetical protein